MTEEIPMSRDEMDRLVLMRSDLDHYEAQVIPDLHQEAHALRDVLRRLVEAAQEMEQLPNPESAKIHRAAMREAERLLADPDRGRG